MPKLILDYTIKAAVVMSLLSVIISSQESFANDISNNIYILKGGWSSHCAFLNSCFKPTNLTIKVGDTVQWHNKDTIVHTISSGTGLQEDYGQLFDSKIISPGDGFSYQFTRSGIFDYFCEIHPWMVGTIKVVESGLDENTK